MHVVLLNPPMRVDRRNIASSIVMPPLWAACLAAVLREAGHRTEILDATGWAPHRRWRHGQAVYRGLSPGEITPLLPETPAVIAVSVPFSSAWPMVRDLIREQAALRPGHVWLAGGEHVTAMARQVLEESPVTVAVQGEGEETVLEVLARLPAAWPETSRVCPNLKGVQGVVWRDASGKIWEEARRPRLARLDDLPRPDWEGVPLQAYFDLRAGHGHTAGPYLPVIASRGCPYRCTFCASPNTWGAPWTARAPHLVAGDLAYWREAYGVEDFHFCDLTLAHRRDWMEAFCQTLLNEDIRVRWQLPSGTRSEALDHHLLRLMRRAGCTHVSLAVESGDPMVLNRTGKQLDLRRQMRAARAVKQAGLHLFGLFMVGFPGETLGEVMKTWRWVLRCAVAGYDEINVSVFAPVPGSVEFQRLARKNSVKVDDAFLQSLFDWATLGRQRSFNNTMSDRTLRWTVYGMFASFFLTSWLLRPWRPLREFMLVLRRRPGSGKGWRALTAFWAERGGRA